MNKHDCPIGANDDGDSSVADNCPCREYYSVEQVAEWLSWLIKAGDPAFFSDELSADWPTHKGYGIAAYFEQKGKA